MQILIVLSLLSAVVAGLPFLRQSGLQILDESNNTVKLRGVNLGGSYLWEAWIFGGGYKSETDIVSGIAEVVGSDAAERFHQDVIDRIVQEEDFKAISMMGFNSVRLPFNHRRLMNPNVSMVWLPSGWALFDRVLDWAEKYNIYVIFDLHAAPGGQALGFIYDSTWPLLWDSAQHKNETLAMWKAIAQRYSNRSVVAGFDLLNEPWPPTDPTLGLFYNQCITAIREEDSKHIMFLEGAQDARNFDTWVTTPLDSNMVYSAHMYLWSQTNATAMLAKYSIMARQQNVPLWIGEFGENFVSETGKQVTSFDSEPTVIGWAFWTWKKVPNGWGTLVGISATPKWTALIKWVGDRAQPMPSLENATLALAEFLNATHYCNCVVDMKYAAVLAQSITSTPMLFNCTAPAVPVTTPISSNPTNTPVSSSSAVPIGVTPTSSQQPTSLMTPTSIAAVAADKAFLLSLSVLVISLSLY